MIVQEMVKGAAQIMSSWVEWKLFLERSTSFSSDSSHVIASVVILLAAGLILKRPLSSWRPWLLLLVLTIVNEISDLWFEQWPNSASQYAEGAKDMLLTMALPTLLLLATRHLPQLFEPPGLAAADDRAISEKPPHC